MNKCAYLGDRRAIMGDNCVAINVSKQKKPFTKWRMAVIM